MADFVRVPEADWQDILDATREKIGTTEKMVSGEVAPAIAGIETGGDEGVVKELLEGTLEEFKHETITAINKNRSFQGVTNLRSVDLPLVTSLSSYTFSGCTSLAEVNLPKLETMVMSNFEDCKALTELVLPNFYRCSNNYNFHKCSNLERIDFQRKDNPIEAYSNNLIQNNFVNCTSLKVLIIRAEDNIWKLGNINNFNGTPFAADGTGGTIYVPAALIESYQTATNWAALYAAGTCNFVAIEGSEYE